jgi:hypothetical protein
MATGIQNTCCQLFFQQLLIESVQRHGSITKRIVQNPVGPVGPSIPAPFYRILMLGNFGQKQFTYFQF